MTQQDHGRDAFIALLMASIEANADMGRVRKDEDVIPAFLKRDTRAPKPVAAALS